MSLRLVRSPEAPKITTAHGLRAPPQLQALEQRVGRVLAHAVASEPTLARMPSSSSANESANFCTPSASSVATTSS